MDIYLIRHTRPDIPTGVCYGQSDIDVFAETFEEETAVIRQKLPHLDHTTVYSSPLQRCSKLASALAPKGYQVDNRLLELNFGDWEMKRWDDLPHAEMDAWMTNFVDIPPTGGETYLHLFKRVTNFWEEIRHTDHSEMAIVTHSGVIRALVVHILGMPLTNLYRFRIDYGSVTHIYSHQWGAEVIHLNS